MVFLPFGEPVHAGRHPREPRQLAGNPPACQPARAPPLGPVCGDNRCIDASPVLEAKVAKEGHDGNVRRDCGILEGGTSVARGGADHEYLGSAPSRLAEFYHARRFDSGAPEQADRWVRLERVGCRVPQRGALPAAASPAFYSPNRS